MHGARGDADPSALPLVAEAVRRAPDVAEIRLHAAHIYRALGRPADAKRELEQALALDAALAERPDVATLRSEAP